MRRRLSLPLITCMNNIYNNTTNSSAISTSYTCTISLSNKMRWIYDSYESQNNNNQ